MTKRLPVSPEVQFERAREAAIDWQVCLSSGQASDAERQAFAGWLAAHPINGRAWHHLGAALGHALHRIEPAVLAIDSPVRRSLQNERGAQRRRLGRIALAMGALFVGAALVDRRIPLRHLSAGFLTGTGERREVALPDGSTMALDARSAADVDFSGGGRVLRLSAGAVIVHVADRRNIGDHVFVPDAQPLRILTDQGEVHSYAGQILVRCEAGRTLCVAFEGESEIVTRAGERRRLSAGQGAWFTARAVDTSRTDLLGAGAWRQGLLDVLDMPLSSVVAALAQYRSGVIRVSPEAGRLRVSGVFPLDDTDRALQALRHTQPITLTRYGSVLVMIDLAPVHSHGGASVRSS